MDLRLQFHIMVRYFVARGFAGRLVCAVPLNFGTALLTGAILALSLSFDGVIVTTFTTGQLQTLLISLCGQML